MGDNKNKNITKVVKPRQRDALNRLEIARDRAKDALSTYRSELAILHSPRVMVINKLIKKLDKSYFKEITSKASSVSIQKQTNPKEAYHV